MNTQLRQPAITTAGLRKSYGEKIVLDGIDLGVAEGTVFALRGLIPLLSCPTERSGLLARLLRKNYASTRSTMVSASTPSWAIASAPASDCIRAMTASMSATSMSTAT